MCQVWTSRSDDAQSGYTLLEVLVVLAIMVILFAALPTLGSQMLESNRFRDAGNNLYSDVRALRQKAQTSGAPTQLSADSLSQHYHGDDEYTLEIEGEIAFFPNGAATSGQIVLRYENRTTVISVDGVTGTILRTDQ